MNTLLIILAIGTLNIVCFLVGAKVGQMVDKGEDIKLPTINPMEAIREHQNKREQEREQSKLDKIMQNIERYDGTSNGQEDV